MCERLIVCESVQICSYMPDFVYVCIFCVLYFTFFFYFDMRFTNFLNISLY